MDLSVIIVNWNTRDLLRACLRSLPAAVGDLAAEVLVVDNASADGSAAMVRDEFPEHTLIDGGANLGFSRGNNLALPRAAGRAVLLLNPDTVCPAGSLARLYAFARERPNLAVAGPRLVDGEGRPALSWGRFPRARYHWHGCVDPRGVRLAGMTRAPGPDEPSRRVEYVTGACFLVPRAALERVGPLDERFFMYFEETDWCLRASRLGLEAWYCAEAEVVHLEGQAAASAGGFGQRQFQKSYRLFIGKHYGRDRLWRFRLAQFCEYGLKSVWRRLAPGDRAANRRLAAAHAARARLQLAACIEAVPPGT